MGFSKFENNVKFDLLPDPIKILINFRNWVIADWEETKCSSAYERYIEFIDWLNLFLLENDLINVSEAPKVKDTDIKYWFEADRKFNLKQLQKINSNKKYKILTARDKYIFVEDKKIDNCFGHDDSIDDYSKMAYTNFLKRSQDLQL